MITAVIGVYFIIGFVTVCGALAGGVKVTRCSGWWVLAVWPVVVVAGLAVVLEENFEKALSILTRGKIK